MYFVICVCVCGCEGVFCCGGVLSDCVLVMLSEFVGVHCPQGSELSGEDSAFCCLLACCEFIGCGDAGAIG